MTYVYDFGDPCEGGRALLGGKGLGLAEMTQLGLPVPPGFTIRTAACVETLRAGAPPSRSAGCALGSRSIAFCDRAGLDYVSCSPYRVPVARLAAAQAALVHDHESAYTPAGG